MRECTAAVLQLCATPQFDASVREAASWCRRALEAGADLVALPENYWGIGPEEAKFAVAVDLSRPEASPLVAPFLELSARTSAILALGGLPEAADLDDAGDGARPRVHNTHALLHRGRIVAAYRKIHLFDADLESGSLRESATVAPGATPTLVRTDLADLGLSICYDLRFPALYRALAAAGAEVVLIPAAFTLTTGIDHWSVLLRARAIETQTYVLAAAQHGRHNPSRHSFGHAMIVDPWGIVVAQASPGDGMALARLRPEILHSVRRALPVGRHHVLDAPTPATIVDRRERGDGSDPRP
ncbi:MAG: carbon-nitrogen hydrolase family protein [Nannocystaceae bacterium]